MSPDNLVRVDRVHLLEFYDERPKSSIGHATAINAVAGEDLGAGLLKHYMENVLNARVTIRPGNCTQGTKSGFRLDRWVCVAWSDLEILYQVEIKNWSAHAIGGRELAVTATREEISKHSIRAWKKEWDSDLLAFRRDGIAKVITPMKPPRNSAVQPLLCMWEPMHPLGDPEPYFEVELQPGGPFAKLAVFSMSAYLRTLTTEFVDIEMPGAMSRMAWLDRLFAVQLAT